MEIKHPNTKSYRNILTHKKKEENIMRNKKVVVSLSGGIDSSTLLAYLLNQECCVIPVFFRYPSKHNLYELEASYKITKHYSLKLQCLDVVSIFQRFKSNLLVSGENIPEGHYEAKSMKQTIVPCRNLIFGSILAGYAQSIKANAIALGVHAGDHFIYPDCRPDFMKSFKEIIELTTEKQITILSPFLNKKKTDIIRIGLQFKVPYKLTRTCYKQQQKACRKCGSCTERLEAFASNNTSDPISYERTFPNENN